MAAIIKETAHPDVNLIFGAVVNPEMKDKVRITVIATGFERSRMPRRVVNQKIREITQHDQEKEEVDVLVGKSEEGSSFQPRSYNTDDLDIPTFLRNRGH